ncbi:MAG: hypothetical protein OEZ36_00635 [Spirochaetota bacterium]|nr:hypothetical protein [Spirochaetota bacterium]
MDDFYDPFLGDKHFEEALGALVDGEIKKVMDNVLTPESVRFRLLDIRRGIRVFMDRSDNPSRKKMKDDYLSLKSDSERAIWLFLFMGRCFYDG